MSYVYNRTEIVRDWAEWTRARDPLTTDKTLLTEIVSLCRQVSIQAIQDQEARVQDKLKSLCARESGHALQASTALAVPSLPSKASKALALFRLRQSSSSQSGWSEVISLVCAFYVLHRLLQTLAQRRPQGPILPTQTQTGSVAPSRNSSRTTGGQRLKMAQSFIFLYFEKMGLRRPEIKAEIPRKALPNEIKMDDSSLSKKRKFLPETEEDKMASPSTGKRLKRGEALPPPVHSPTRVNFLCQTMSKIDSSFDDDAVKNMILELLWHSKGGWKLCPITIPLGLCDWRSWTYGKTDAMGNGVETETTNRTSRRRSDTNETSAMGRQSLWNAKVKIRGILLSEDGA